MFNFDIEKIIALAPAVIGFLSIFIEISPIRFSPISLLLKWMATILNKNVYTKLDEIEQATKKNRQSIDNLKADMDTRFNTVDREAAEKEAKRLRANIIIFADSCRVGTRHTQNHFENIFRDITDYFDYCHTYNIDNHYIEAEHTYIREVFQECLKNNKFL